MRIPFSTSLQTQRCLLQCVSDDDNEYIWTASRYPGFTDGMSWDPPETKQEISEWTKRNLERWENDEAYAFTIRSLSEDEFIGRIGIRSEPGNSKWSIGYWIHPDHWNKGYATEAGKALINFAFEVLEANTIEAGHVPENVPSRRVLEKLGMIHQRVNLQGFQKRGEWMAGAVYQITREEWLGSKTQDICQD